jgi:hypothetical protein
VILIHPSLIPITEKQEKLYTGQADFIQVEYTATAISKTLLKICLMISLKASRWSFQNASEKCFPF